MVYIQAHYRLYIHLQATENNSLMLHDTCSIDHGELLDTT